MNSERGTETSSAGQMTPSPDSSVNPLCPVFRDIKIETDSWK